jgi:hypothetical protein
MLTNGQRAVFLDQHVALADNGSLIRRSGHFVNKPIVGERFLVAGRQFETAAVKDYLQTGSMSPPRLQGRRKGGGYVSREACKLADDRLLALIAERPTAGVRALAQGLGMSHPAISRRLARLKAMGVVDRVGGRWRLEAPRACPPWVPPLRVKMQREDADTSLRRFG